MDEKVRSEFRDELLTSHNALRAVHGSKQLRYSEELSRDTQMWADIIADKGYVQFSELPGRGENISFVETSGPRPDGGWVTELWYKEIENYDYVHPRWNKDSMNFTQIIWKSSTEIGVGISKVKGQDRYVVIGHYRPSGNMNTPGEFRKNVLPPVVPSDS